MKNKSLLILLSSNGLVLLSSALIGPIYAFLVEDIGGSILDAGFSFSAFAIAAAIITLISGKLSDRIKEEEYILMTGYFIMGLGFFSLVFVNSIFALALSQVVIGIGEALYSAPFDGIFSKHLDKGSFGSEWGMWEAMNYITLAIGAISGSFLVTNFGFNFLFITMSLLCLFAMIIILLSPRELL
jgi:MFS family permease